MIKKLNSLTILFIITVIMVLLMLVTIYRTQETTDDFSLLFPGLFKQLSDVDTITFNSTQDQFTLFKEGEDWFVRERWNYPADFNEVKRALIDIAEAKILERKTDKPEQHMMLGVEGSDGESVEITMFDKDVQLAGLVLGSQRQTNVQAGPQQFYVRRSGEDRTWLAEGYFNFSPVMLNWIKTEVINIARERVAKVSIIQPGGATATIINLGQKDKFGTPASREKTIFKYEQLGYDIAGSLYQLRMEDVQPVDDFSRGNAEVVTAEFTTFDGLKVISETSFNDGYYYATFRAEYDEAAIDTAPADIQKLDVLKTADEVKQEVESLNKLLSPWVYRLGGFVGTNLMRAKSDMVTESSDIIPMPADITGFGP